MADVEPEEIIGRSLTLILAGSTEAGEDDWAIFPGTVIEDEGVLYLHRGGERPRFEIRREWLGRVRAVDGDLRSLLADSDYCLPLGVGPLPDGADTHEFEQTGLRWPESPSDPKADDPGVGGA